jgi:hypothetical protein
MADGVSMQIPSANKELSRYRQLNEEEYSGKSWIILVDEIKQAAEVKDGAFVRNSLYCLEKEEQEINCNTKIITRQDYRYTSASCHLCMS